jgi:hypothetical protein
MTYHPPELPIAYRLIEDILAFMESCGGPYVNLKENIDKHKYDGIIRSIYHGQFIFKKDWYFACWFRLTDESLELVKKYIMPEDVSSGDILYVNEFAVKKGMRELVHKIEVQNKTWCKGWCKHRNVNTWKYFRRTP